MSHKTRALLVCKVPLGAEAGPSGLSSLEKVHERGAFRDLAWLTERIRNIDGQFSEWQEVAPHEHDGKMGEVVACHRCAPVSPAILWTKGKKGKIVAVEDTVQAGECERSLKRRPAPCITQLKVDGDGVGTVRIGVNIASLVHRAFSCLPNPGRTESTPTIGWRLDTDFRPSSVKVSLPKFKFASNRLDKEHKQPPSFGLPLHPEQFRSLTWMLEQEKKTAPPSLRRRSLRRSSGLSDGARKVARSARIMSVGVCSRMRSGTARPRYHSALSIARRTMSSEISRRQSTPLATSR